MKPIENFLSSHPYAPTTKRTYQNVLHRLVEEHQDLSALHAADLIKFISKSEWENSRQCVALAASKKYLAWLYGTTHPALSAKLKRIQGEPQRALTADQAMQLLASFNPFKSNGARDLAICALALDTGLRVSELCRLKQADTDTEHGTLQVVVKGGQWKAAIFSQQTALHIEHWKAFRQTLKPQGFLFVNTFTGQGLTPHGLQSIVKTWGQKIGIKLSPHDLRRSFAVLATEAGAPERVLMEGGRWSSSQMIARYTRTLKLEAMRQYLPTERIANLKNLR